ncbi:PQQ-binding-like beta-propeller repeat protein [Streptomyces sp. TLI_171]|uniref:outer membrane protein assembly factor BamB family protein n=1 Tax=Streptomyces sp. TLI_171 TaxID=1938859 RepID=UPI000C17F915|nr:PQQ-binding-like beta-propeller repeat protein [Streptomyces sp. TLI_171]RKE21849.1 putative pyrroloquinoline-quinone binding quinoprotein [Streptomyces sp. TLI_171]
MAQEPPTTPGYDQQPWYPQPQQQPYGEQQAYEQQFPQQQGYQDPQAYGYPQQQPGGYVDPAAQQYYGEPYGQQVYEQQQFPQQQGYQDPQAYTDQQLYGDPSVYGYPQPQTGLYAPAEPGPSPFDLPQPDFEPAVPAPDPAPATASDYPQTSDVDPFAPGADGTSIPLVDPDADGSSDARPAAGGFAARARAAVLSGQGAPSRRGLAIRVGAGVAALAVLVTAGILATSGDDEKPADTAAKGTTQNIAVAHTKAWTAAADPAAAGAQGADDTLVGSWLLADAVVRADATGVRAYGLADGKPTWTLAPPADGAVPCGLSPTVNGSGLGAVVYRPAADPNSPCSTAVAVDTKAGQAVWSKTLSDAKEKYATHVSVTDDKVIAIGDDKAAAWMATDGAEAWQYGGQGKYCSLSGGAGPGTVLLHSNCADSTPADQAVALNVADGKVKYWRGLNNQPKTVTVLSAEPAVVLTTGNQPADDRVFAWGAEGDPAVEIPVAVEGGGRLDASHGAFSAVPGVYFQGSSMFAAVVPDTGGNPTAIAAYDLATGKAQWRTPIAEKAKARPVGADSGGLLVAVDERSGQPAHLSRFALAGGQETQGGAFPQGTGSLLSAGRVHSTAGHLVAVPEHAANFGIATGFTSKN